ncbi:unnamed protein product [Ilex paraguariensis]|uniref:Uncharacterized protein n=1 Tax=Ilex paraguariensis TaxID=185542 RepID=A0ABC8SWR7_9AQUA
MGGVFTKKDQKGKGLSETKQCFANGKKDQKGKGVANEQKRKEQKKEFKQNGVQIRSNENDGLEESKFKVKQNLSKLKHNIQIDDHSGKDNKNNNVQIDDIPDSGTTETAIAEVGLQSESPQLVQSVGDEQQAQKEKVLE